MFRHRYVLRDLPFTARVVIAVFLLSVGVGYLSALVQLHFQHAGPGQVVPTREDVIRHFHGSPGAKVSQLQKLIEAPDKGLPFNGTGSMSAAFFEKSNGWRGDVKKRPEAEVRAEREGERQAVLAWLKAGLSEASWDADRFELAAPTKLTAEFKAGDQAVKIRSLWAERCGRCHMNDGDDANAASYPLETLAQIQKYAKVDPTGGAVSLEKLAQSTHAHLLSFSMLFGLTGLVIAFSSYPAWVRLPLAPVVLFAQMADISCWWLARLEGPVGEQFAVAIMVTGGVVGAGLMLQIVLGLWDLFGWFGKLMLILLFAVAGYAGYVANERVIEPFLQQKLKDQPAPKA